MEQRRRDSTSPRLLLLLAVLIIASAAPLAAARRHPLAPALFVFGDSQLDAGNNFYIRNSPMVSNFSPYGETYFHRPTGRWTNGRTIADFLALHLGLPLVPPSMQPGVKITGGLNFASGGSGLLDSTSQGEAVLPIRAQLAQFQRVVANLTEQLGQKPASKLLEEAVFIMASGSNDFGINYLQNSTLQQTVTPQQFIASLIAEYENTILSLHQGGARKLAIFEIGTLGCTPSARFAASLINQTGCLDAANQLAVLFNTGLYALVQQLRPKLADMHLSYVKTFAIFSNISQHALHLGFTTTDAACCGAGPFNAVVRCGQKVPPGYPYKAATGKMPSKFLFWDGSHPTDSTYGQIFKRVWSGSSEAIEPLNLQQLARVARSRTS